MTVCHSVVYLIWAQYHCRRWYLCCGSNSSRLNRHHKHRPPSTSWQQMVLINMGTSRVSWAYCRMEVELVCEATTPCCQMHQSIFADIVDGTQIGAFEKPNQISFTGFLQSCDSRALKMKISFEILSSFSCSVCTGTFHAPVKPLYLLELPPLMSAWHSMLLHVSSVTKTKFLQWFL